MANSDREEEQLMLRRTLTMCLVVMLVALACTTPALADAAGSVMRFNREAYSYSTQLSTSAEANRYDVMVLNAGDARFVPALHAANPHLLIFVYQTVLQAQPTDPSGLTTCTPWSSDSASHPNWYLADQYGHRINDVDYPTNALMDVGNPAYQQACVAHAVAQARTMGFNGIYFDDVTAWVGWTFPSGVRAPEYPTQGSWQQAMTSFVDHAAHASPLPIIANIGGATAAPGLWQRWAGPLFGAEEESWTDGGSGLAQQLPDFAAKLANIAWSEAHHKYTLLHSYNSTPAGLVYGLAATLLVAGGETSWSTSNSNYTTSETWLPEYSTAQNLGAPLGQYTRLANGVYERRFQHGLVLVNATTQPVASFAIGGGSYSGSGLTRATYTAMGPTSGLILMRVNAPAHHKAKRHKAKKHKRAHRHKHHRKHTRHRARTHVRRA